MLVGDVERCRPRLARTPALASFMNASAHAAGVRM
jgi:hypothetical protein